MAAREAHDADSGQPTGHTLAVEEHPCDRGDAEQERCAH